MNWDWYSCTVSEPPDAVLGALAEGQDLVDVRPVKGLYSYDRGAQLHRGDRVLVTAYWGGVNGDDSTHLQGTGADAPWVVNQVRTRWPAHRVARADVCEDFVAPGMWQRLSEIGLRVARDHRLKTNTVGDWIDGLDGRTLYLGARTARMRCRVYEKGIQVGGDRDWVRAEVQVRPSGEGKTALCALEPAQILGASSWTRDLADALGMPDIAAVRVRDPWQPSEDQRALSFCLQQYGAVLGRKAAALGGFDKLGEYIGGVLKPVAIGPGKH